MDIKELKSISFLSLFCGAIFAAIAYFVLKCLLLDEALKLSLVSSALFAALLYVFLVIYQYRNNRKYLNAEKVIVSPVFYKANGNFNTGEKVKNGNIYFCDDGIVFICLDEKPHITEKILLNDISVFEYDNIHLNITVKDGRLYCITLPDVSEIIEMLKAHEWIEN